MKNLYEIDSAFEKQDIDLLDKYYKTKFPAIKTIERITDYDLQRKGVDVILTSKKGLQLKIDEKKRRKFYGDLFLERYSSYEKKTPGWGAKLFQKGYLTDILAVFFMDKRIVYWLNVEILKNWIIKNKYKFGTGLKPIFNQIQQYKNTNINYHSMGYVIPFDELGIQPERF